MKIRQVGAELFHAETDGRTDMNLIVAFRNFTKEPKKIEVLHQDEGSNVTLPAIT